MDTFSHVYTVALNDEAARIGAGWEDYPDFAMMCDMGGPL